MRGTRKHNLGVLASLLAGCFFLALPAAAQSLGDVARQQRAHKPAESRCASRVYTNEDLARPEILDPRDRACYQAARENAPPLPPEVPAPPVIAADDTRLPPVALGELARQLRRAREQAAATRVEPAAPLRSFRARRATPKASRPASQPRPSVSARIVAVAPPRLVRQFEPTNDNAPAAVQVRRGDSLWKLAAEHLGSGFAWRKLAELNPEITNPDLIYVGQWIRLSAEAPAASARYVQVQEGDTLWELAQAEFGSGQAWPCIAQANPELRDANLIFPGQRLALPSACPAR